MKLDNDIINNDYKNDDILSVNKLKSLQLKSIKYLQREITYLTSNSDSYHHIIDSRFMILERAFLAKIRSRKRMEV